MEKKMKKVLDVFLCLFLSILAIMGSTLAFDYSLVMRILLFVIILIISIIGKRKEKRTKWVSLIFSILYSFIYVLGSNVYDTGGINSLYQNPLILLDTVIAITGTSYLLYLINYYLFYLIDKYKIKTRESKLLNKSYIFL